MLRMEIISFIIFIVKIIIRDKTCHLHLLSDAKNFTSFDNNDVFCQVLTSP